MRYAFSVPYACGGQRRDGPPYACREQCRDRTPSDVALYGGTGRSGRLPRDLFGLEIDKFCFLVGMIDSVEQSGEEHFAEAALVDVKGRERRIEVLAFGKVVESGHENIARDFFAQQGEGLDDVHRNGVVCADKAFGKGRSGERLGEFLRISVREGVLFDKGCLLYTSDAADEL